MNVGENRVVDERSGRAHPADLRQTVGAQPARERDCTRSTWMATDDTSGVSEETTARADGSDADEAQKAER
jgi:hypothetical protein